MIELRGVAGSGGNSTSEGVATVGRGASQSIAFRLTKNEATITATPSKILLTLTGGRILAWIDSSKSLQGGSDGRQTTSMSC
jgi:hypothetical protein